MWILHFLPDALILWICNIVLLAGILLTVAAFFIRRIPVINQYRTPAQILGIALLVTGVYWRGGYAIEMEWRERVSEVEKKVLPGDTLIFHLRLESPIRRGLVNMRGIAYVNGKEVGEATMLAQVVKDKVPAQTTEKV